MEAVRALKRRLSDIVYLRMIDDTPAATAAQREPDECIHTHRTRSDF